MSAHDDDGPFREEASESATTMSECTRDDGRVNAHETMGDGPSRRVL